MIEANSHNRDLWIGLQFTELLIEGGGIGVVTEVGQSGKRFVSADENELFHAGLVVELEPIISGWNIFRSAAAGNKEL